MTFNRVPGSHGQFNSHYTGIYLECIEAGHEYRASVPFFDIHIFRLSESEKFEVEFRGPRDRYPGIRLAILTAGRNLTSVERCIINAVNMPSRLHKFNISPPEGKYFPPGEDDQEDQFGGWDTAEYVEQNTEWPDRPGPDDQPDYFTVLEVKYNHIYRLVSRDYSIGVWRNSSKEDFSVKFRKIESPYSSMACVQFMAGMSLDSVEDLVLRVLSDQHKYLWRIRSWRECPV